MSIVIGIITFILVLNCLLLMLLVLVQLPKKEAGLGQAFGGATTEALFGAGSGNALTKLTKYCAGFFFGLTLLLVILNGHAARSRGGDPRQFLNKADRQADAMASPAAAAETKPAAATNLILSSTLITNAAKALTNAIPAAAVPDKK